MCGRVWVKSSVGELLHNFAFARAGEAERLGNVLPRFNGAPGQDYPIIITELDQPGAVFISARWGFIPHWMKDPKGGRKPINAVSETVAVKPMFRAAYRQRRALMPIDGFFEWRAIRGERVKQPYAVAMADGTPFALAAIWESWLNPATGLEMRTFAVLTCQANELIAEIHNRMPVIVAPTEYDRWLGDEPDPHDLLKPFPAELMKTWPISTRINSPKNDTPDLLDPLEDG